MTVAYPSGVPPDARNPESRMMAEYVLDKFPQYRVMLRQPLGPPVVGADVFPDMARRLNASRPWRPEVDAVVVLEDHLLFVEGKVNEPLYGLAKLPAYAALADETPELAAWKGWEVRMRLVVPFPVTWLELAAQKAGVEVDVYFKPWMQTYLDYVGSYHTQANRRFRAERQAAREKLGL